MVKWTTKLNTPGESLANLPDVHALTDVTGFGLAGHLLEICRGSGLSAQVAFADLPLIADALEWAKQGVATGASDRNWKSYGDQVSLPGGFAEWKRKLVSDPQTSGGLLVACAPHAVQGVLSEFEKEGFAEAKTIGKLSAGPAKLVVT